jgi:hypothetical protein
MRVQGMNLEDHIKAQLLKTLDRVVNNVFKPNQLPELRPNEDLFNVAMRKSCEFVANVLETVTNLIYCLHKLLYHVEFCMHWPLHHFIWVN